MTYTAIDPKIMQSLFMKNPFMSQWLSIANTMAGTARGFWAAEFARQQNAVIAAMSRETMRFWSQAWTMWPAEAARLPERAAEAIDTAVGATAGTPRRALPAKVDVPMLTVPSRAKRVAAKRATRQPAAAKRKSRRR